MLSLDDLRGEVAAQVAARGGPVRPPQAWTLAALREAAARRDELLAQGLGYVADSTHLRRRERVGHVQSARAAGLPVRAVLLPALPLAVLLARDALRPPDEQVPPDVLARHVHRRSLLSPALLREEGFVEVLQES